MLAIEKVDTGNKAQVKRFVEFPYQLYKDCPQWAPPLFLDAYLPLNRKKHPFFGHSEADFFLAVRDGEAVGRVCAGINKPFNEYHGTKKAQFSLFESVDDQEVANALFASVFNWARARGMDTLIGPKGLSPFDGYGILEPFLSPNLRDQVNAARIWITLGVFLVLWNVPTVAYLLSAQVSYTAAILGIPLDIAQIGLDRFRSVIGSFFGG